MNYEYEAASPASPAMWARTTTHPRMHRRAVGVALEEPGTEPAQVAVLCIGDTDLTRVRKWR
jgi:hypothetical protein